MWELRQPAAPLHLPGRKPPHPERKAPRRAPRQALFAFALREAGGALREPTQARAAAACSLRVCEGAVVAGLPVREETLAALLHTLAPPTALEPQVHRRLAQRRLCL